MIEEERNAEEEDECGTSVVFDYAPLLINAFPTYRVINQSQYYIADCAAANSTIFTPPDCFISY
jgi:hypothetical protein